LRMAFRWFGAPRILQADNGSLLFVLYKHTCTHTHAHTHTHTHTHTLTVRAPGPGPEFKGIATNTSRSRSAKSTPSPKKRPDTHGPTGVEHYRCEEFDKELITELRQVNAI
jgi:hypothetical protein